MFMMLYRNLQIEISFFEKFSNTDLRVSAKVYRPNLTTVNYSLLRAREDTFCKPGLPRGSQWGSPLAVTRPKHLAISGKN